MEADIAGSGYILEVAPWKFQCTRRAMCVLNGASMEREPRVSADRSGRVLAVPSRGFPGIIESFG